MKQIVIDTNTYAALQKGDDKVRNIIETADVVWVPLIVIAELLFGFKNGSKEIKNKSLLNKFLSLSGISVFYPTLNTAIIYAQIATVLKQNGRPIPSNDIWIACCVIETQSTLISYDKHFQFIPNLSIWK